MFRRAVTQWNGGGFPGHWCNIKDELRAEQQVRCVLWLSAPPVLQPNLIFDILTREEGGGVMTQSLLVTLQMFGFGSSSSFLGTSAAVP